MKIIYIYTGGISRGNPGPSAIGVQITDASGKVLKEISQSIGNATNNFSEYQAVVQGLETAKQLFGSKTAEMEFELKLDNELVKKQLNNEHQIKEPGLVPFFIHIHNMRIESFPNLIFTEINRELNKEVVRLVNEALDA